ncbi:MAG TPA: hypothetical protein VMW25_04480 [Clostridia bacterium]|nr:hypothetical protein [Clostridia bacterium]
MENLESPPVTVKEGVKVPLFGTVVLVLVFSALSTFLAFKLLGNKTATTSSPVAGLPDISSSPERCQTLKFSPLPESKFKSYPQVQTETDKALVLLPLEKGPGREAVEVDTGVRFGWGELFYGSSDPLPSPDLNLIAYIKDSRLWLVSADGSQKTRVSDQLSVTYLSGWSPDSRYLIVQSVRNDINEMFAGMITEDTRQFSKDELGGGTYLIDTQKGEVSLLSPVKNFVSWLDSQRILAVYDGFSQNPSYVVFDIEKYLANSLILREVFVDYFAVQFSVSQAAGKWALALGRTGGQGGGFSKIVLADFPKTEGIVVDEGRWAQVQVPVLAPDGERLLYEKRDDPNQPVVYYWDGARAKKLVEGFGAMWVDEKRLVFRREKDKVFLYDLEASDFTPLN